MFFYYILLITPAFKFYVVQVKQDMKTTTTVDPSHADDDDATSIENKTKGYMLSTGQWKDGTWKATDQSFQIENTK